MLLNIPLTPEMEARLRERAAAEGKDPIALALEAVNERVLAQDLTASQATAAAQKEAWNHFLAGVSEHAKTLPPGIVVDDSRESIYEGRGE
jgi:hypothetical protein